VAPALGARRRGKASSTRVEGRPAQAEAARAEAPASITDVVDGVDARVGGGGMLASAVLCALKLVAGDALAATLPPPPDVPARWDDARLEALEASPLRARAAQTRRLWTHCHAALGLAMGLDAFLAVLALVRSRAYSARPLLTMVPVLEMANHDLAPAASKDFDGERFRLEALADLEAGDEVTISYGPLSNAELLGTYGFVLDSNPRDALAFAVAADDAVPGSRPSAEESLGLHDKLAPGALRCLRERLVTHEDSVNAAIRGVDGAMDFGLPLTLRNEREAVAALAREFDGRLASYSPPADDAARLEIGGLPTWEENAVRVRLGEKLVLLQQLERAAKSLETLQ